MPSSNVAACVKRNGKVHEPPAQPNPPAVRRAVATLIASPCSDGAHTAESSSTIRSVMTKICQSSTGPAYGTNTYASHRAARINAQVGSAPMLAFPDTTPALDAKRAQYARNSTQVGYLRARRHPARRAQRARMPIPRPADPGGEAPSSMKSILEVFRILTATVSATSTASPRSLII